MTPPQGGDDKSIKVIPPKTVVRKLAVGQEVKGRVKRVADFGAFIDIGVGTDALVHVSEMSPVRVNKPADIVKVGQQVDCWIKDLDKDKNRISLTMIAPNTRTIRDLTIGEVVTCTVTRLVDFGAFVDLGVGYEGFIHVKEMGHGYVKHPSDVVKVGDVVEAEIQKINRQRGKIDLSMRTLLPEPEPEQVVAAPAEVLAEEEAAQEEEEALPTVFEMALLDAQRTARARKDKKRQKNKWYLDDEDDDDYVSRTLSLTDDL